MCLYPSFVSDNGNNESEDLQWKLLCLCVTEKNIIKYTDTNKFGQTLNVLFISFNIFLHRHFFLQLQPVNGESVL